MALTARFILRSMVATFIGYCVAVLGINAIGLTLPAQTSQSISITLQRSPDEIVRLLADTDTMPSWNRRVRVVDNASAPSRKHIVVRTPAGCLPLTVNECGVGPSRRVVAMIGSERARYFVKRTYEIIPIADGASSVRVTEQVQAFNPLLRVLLRIFQPKLLQEDVEDIQRKFAGLQICIEESYSAS
jgi:hypothetical protein